jgi:hypothetical protein
MRKVQKISEEHLGRKNPKKNVERKDLVSFFSLSSPFRVS